MVLWAFVFCIILFIVAFHSIMITYIESQKKQRIEKISVQFSLPEEKRYYPEKDTSFEGDKQADGLHELEKKFQVQKQKMHNRRENL